ncbi:Colicin V production protein [compost metagenome]
MAMTWFDTALVLFILIQIALGLRQGFLLSVSSLLTLVLSASLALFGGPWLATQLSPFISGPRSLLALVLAMLLGLAVSPLAAIALSQLIAKRPASPRFQRMDRTLGMASGALRGLLVASFLVGVYATMTASVPDRGTLSGTLYQVTERPAEALNRHVQREFPSLLVTSGGWELVTEAASASEELPPDRLAREMLALVNQERRERGLVELRWDGRLAVIALAHSKDMLARNYFAHEDPEGRSATYRAEKAGIPYTILGENLAFAKTLPQAHRGLMNSPGHRENILRPEFRRLGIGIVRLPANSRYLPKQAAPAGAKPRTGGYLLITQVFAK